MWASLAGAAGDDFLSFRCGAQAQARGLSDCGTPQASLIRSQHPRTSDHVYIQC